MSPGDVVLIRFPQTDLQIGKLRPALVVAIAPGRYADVLLALISSRTHQAVPEFDELIEPSEVDYAATGLKVRSVDPPGAVGQREYHLNQCSSGQNFPRSFATCDEPNGCVVGVW